MKTPSHAKGNPVHFQIDAPHGAEVFVAGSFNNWNARQYRLREAASEGLYEATIVLPPGCHEYKFVINGEWRLDANCPNWVQNDRGALNSVLTI